MTCSNGSVSSCAWLLSRLHHFFPWYIWGHSMWAGGATSLAAAGIPPLQIQAIGQWQLDSFECYSCCYPILLQAVLFHGQSHDPPFADDIIIVTSFLHHSSHQSFLSYITDTSHFLSSLSSLLTPCYSFPSGFIMYFSTSRCLGVPWLPVICNTILRWTIPSWFCWHLILMPHPRLVQLVPV